LTPKKPKLRRKKYLNNIQEPDQRFTKRRVRQSQWFQSFYTAKHTIDGYKKMDIIWKEQVKNLARTDVAGHIKFINKLFGIAA
jgi:transposase-like protein